MPRIMMGPLAAVGVIIAALVSLVHGDSIDAS
jgi:hypothetical protein